MAVVGELEGLVSNHNLLISRGSIVEAAKIKALIGTYLSQKEMVSRFYKALRGKFEEFLYCAETNFGRFKEIINYKQLTQMEYYYPDYFKEFGRDTKKSAEAMFSSGNQLYAGLLCASSIYTERQILFNVADHFIKKKNYVDLERIFERLDETRQMIITLNAEAGNSTPVLLISDEEVAQKIGTLIFEAYSEETKNMETMGSDYNFVKNAYKLANILSIYLPEQGLITEGSLVSTATIYFKEIARRVDIDSTEDLVFFLDQFKKNPAVRHFAQENPGMFQNYMNSPDVRDVLYDLMRNLLGKTRFDEAKRLSDSLENIISFTPIFREQLATLKENGFFVQAIEMAEKMQLKEEITDELKLEAFRKLMEDFEEKPVKGSALQRLKKFSLKYKINTQNYSKIKDEVPDRLEAVEKKNPEIAKDINSLYVVLNLERKIAKTEGSSMGKLFEPVIWFFSFIFRLFVSLIIMLATRSVPKTAAEKGRDSKTS